MLTANFACILSPWGGLGAAQELPAITTSGGGCGVHRGVPTPLTSVQKATTVPEKRRRGLDRAPQPECCTSQGFSEHQPPPVPLPAPSFPGGGGTVGARGGPSTMDSAGAAAAAADGTRGVPPPPPSPPGVTRSPSDTAQPH